MREAGTVDEHHEGQHDPDDDALEDVYQDDAEEGGNGETEIDPTDVPEGDENRKVDQFPYGMDDDCAKHGFGKRLEEPSQRYDRDQYEHCSENARHLRLLTGTYTSSRLRKAPVNNEAATQPRPEVGNAEADHLLVGVDLISEPGCV